MPKYNLVEKKDKKPEYLAALSVQLVDKLYEQILIKFVVEKKHHDSTYSAAKLAKELGSNVRYVSATVNLRYRDNFSQLINDFRIKEAQYMLTDKHFAKNSVEEISRLVGFRNRQCFYSAFFRRLNMSPAEYRTKNKI